MKGRDQGHLDAPGTQETDPTRDSFQADATDNTHPDEAEQGVGAPACSSREEIREWLRTGIMISIPRRRR